MVSVRDLLAWVKFMNTCHPKLDAVACFYHGAHLVFLDALGEEPRLKIKMLTYLEEALCRLNLFVEDCGDGAVTGCTLEGTFGVSPFYIPCGMPASHSYIDIYLLCIRITLTGNTYLPMFMSIFCFRFFFFLFFFSLRSSPPS